MLKIQKTIRITTKMIRIRQKIIVIRMSLMLNKFRKALKEKEKKMKVLSKVLTILYRQQKSKDYIKTTIKALIGHNKINRPTLSLRTFFEGYL
jgi:hypothetical protein